MNRSPRCPACGAPRLPMPACPECGAAYPAEPPPEEAAGAVWTGEADDARLERRLRLYAPPIALALAWLAMKSDGLRSLARIFDAMWLHELGHAIAAWLSGFAALPGPWRTSMADGRSPLFALLVAAGIALAGWRAWASGRRRLAAAAGALLALQAVLTVGLRPQRAQALILFAGDGGGLVLGAALVCTFFVARGSHLHRTWLRWGFLFLGAFGFMDPFTTWWAARRNPDVIAFGHIEGVGDSDPTRLVDEHGFGLSRLVGAYVALGVACLAVMVAAMVRDALRAPPRSDQTAS